MISSVGILLRCLFCGLLALIIPIVPQQRARKEAGMTFNNWQTIFIFSSLTVLGEHYLYKWIPIAIVPQCFILIDMTLLYVLCKWINHMALTPRIAKQNTKIVVQSFLINKLSTIILVYIVLAATQTTQVMSLEFREEAENYLWLFEMPLNVDYYIQNIVISNLNNQYSIQFLLTLVLTHILVCFTILWFFNNIMNMSFNYKICIFGVLLFVLSSYNRFLYSLATITEMSIYTIVFVASMIYWWWTQEYKNILKLPMQNL